MVQVDTHRMQVSIRISKFQTAEELKIKGEANNE